MIWLYYWQEKVIAWGICYPLFRLSRLILRVEIAILKKSTGIRRKWDKEMFRRQAEGL